jgi:RNA polymerase sigma factor (sigma-70 family)
MANAARSVEFERLAIPLLGSLYNHACWLTRDPSEAEDLVQETFSKALRAFASFQVNTNFKAWVFRILRNTFLTSRTSIASSRTVSLEESQSALETADESPSAEDYLIRLDNQAAVQMALEQLPGHLRDVLLLCDVDELKYKEIAVILEVPIGTVMSRVSRGRGMLRALLANGQGDSAQ